MFASNSKLKMSSSVLKIKKLSDLAIIPTRGSQGAAGYDLSSAYEGVVPARGKALLKTDLAIAVPHGTYGRVAPRSGLTWKNSIDTGAGVIDEDYRGNVGVGLFRPIGIESNACSYERECLDAFNEYSTLFNHNEPIDSQLYVWILQVILFNHSDVDFKVNAGDRIAQLVLEKIEVAQVVEVEDLDSTERGAGGFGSTGVQAAAAPSVPEEKKPRTE